MEESKKNIIVIGIMGFPYGTAPIQKLFLMGKSIARNGWLITVISNTYVKKSKLNQQLTQSGEIDGIRYLTTSPYVHTPKLILKKIYGKISGKVNELFHIIKLIRNNKCDNVIIYSWDFWYCLFYGILFKMFKIPVQLVYFELRSTMSNKKSFLKKINNYFFDNYVFKLVNGVILISENLIKHVNKKYPDIKYIKVPPLADFDLFKKDEHFTQSNYFLFCGSFAYSEIIHFILKSYSNISIKHNIKLFLVLNGDSSFLPFIEKVIQDLRLSDKVRIISGLSFVELANYFMHAKALLIPLRNTPQDLARFPQKIAEYCAAARPIVSTEFGEVSFYFDDNSALLAKDYDVDLFTEKLEYSIQNPEQCELIAKKGYLIGKKYFDYKAYSQPFKDFLLS